MKNNLILSLIFLFIAATSVLSQDTISSKDAKNFIGEEKTVRGEVAAVFISNKGTILINFDENFPNASFVAVIKEGSDIIYDNIKKGSVLTVSGTITEFKGKPEIIISAQSQIINVE